jgi:CHAD domain-containing protein
VTEMAFQLKPDETLAKGIRRIAKGQLDKALDGLTGLSGEEPEEVVHDARKRFKKVRAVLRLARSGLGRTMTDRENARLRDAGRPLSEVRDAGVMLEAFEELVERFGAPDHSEAVSKIRSALTDRKQEVVRRVLHEEKALAAVAAAVRDVRSDVKRWKVKGDEWDVLGRGLKRIYRGGYDAFLAASDDPTDENLHEWRKRVKDLWYALDILGPVRPGFTEGRGDQSHRLADALGDDHDLAVLRQLLSDPETGAGDRAAVEAIGSQIDRRRGELQRDARCLGEEVYPERPKVFVARFGAYWRAWRAETEASRFG